MQFYDLWLKLVPTDFDKYIVLHKFSSMFKLGKCDDKVHIND